MVEDDAAKEVQLHIITDEEGKLEEENRQRSFPPNALNQTLNPPPSPKTYQWWIKVAIYSFFLLSSQAVATLLGRLYYDRGGNSKWLATLVQPLGFPILIPFYFLSPNPKPPITTALQSTAPKPPSLRMLALIYVSIGSLLALDCYLYSVGLLYLPVSTYSLICATQLAFNALFSFLLNGQKFTPYITNSLVLLTISSTLLVFQSDSENPEGVSKAKYAIGFVCTVAASAGYSLILSLTQLAFKKVIKKETFRTVIDMLMYQSIVATAIIIVGLFASGEWKGLHKEFEGYTQGKVSYVMNLTWTAISWQIFGIGAVGLIFEVSSLFSNAISVLGLPVVPVLAVVFFHDKMSGIKVVAMVLAVWGFISYVYQHYVDDCELKKIQRNTDIGASSSS